MAAELIDMCHISRISIPDQAYRSLVCCHSRILQFGTKYFSSVFIMEWTTLGTEVIIWVHLFLLFSPASFLEVFIIASISFADFSNKCTALYRAAGWLCLRAVRTLSGSKQYVSSAGVFNSGAASERKTQPSLQEDLRHSLPSKLHFVLQCKRFKAKAAKYREYLPHFQGMRNISMYHVQYILSVLLSFFIKTTKYKYLSR